MHPERVGAMAQRVHHYPHADAPQLELGGCRALQLHRVVDGREDAESKIGIKNNNKKTIKISIKLGNYYRKLHDLFV